MIADEPACVRRTLHVLASVGDAETMIAEVADGASGESHWVLSDAPPPRERLLPQSVEWIHVPRTVAPGGWAVRVGNGDPSHADGVEIDTLKELVDAFKPGRVRFHGGDDSPVARRVRVLVPPEVIVESSRPGVGKSVAYVLKKFPRYSETFIMREVLALEEMGVRVQVFSLNPPMDGRFHSSLARLGHTVEYLPEVGGSKGFERLLPLLPPGARERETLASLFWECLDRGRPQLLRSLAQGIVVARRVRELDLGHIHAHFATSASEVARFASRFAGVGFSFTAHAKDIYSDEVDHAGLALKLRDASFAVTVCEANRRYLEERHPAESGKVRRLYNGIDLLHHDAAAPADSEAAVPHILAVGRFVEKKGFELLVDALAELSRDGGVFTAEIVGDGERLESVREKVAGLGLDHVVSLPGACSSEQVREKMRRAVVLVCPCIVAENGDKDALPTVLLEALAEGLPCVATDVAGISEILDEGRAGLIVEPSPSALASGVRELIHDGARREMYRARGLERVAELFDLSANARVLASWFTSTGAGARAAVSEATSGAVVS